ncbi:hypothetical protein AXG93_3088s1000 [Marchantia polymorpha subsp. ruderalis]|uniref:Retrotransposon gag domain-containing protein n=1 Tax=Marchantia polymorpha subsp. ruderalis TaxID=1480154 RepID=A0A176VKV4_MARPO|nr:hypothetical protein AXG93_3088s1000 [Marchantia polymorpha subsp. ruderalis]
MSTGEGVGKLRARATRKLRRDSEKAVEEARRQREKTKTSETLPKPSLTNATDGESPGASDSNFVLTLFMKHSYPKYKGSGDDDNADSYIKLFESVSTTNREKCDNDRFWIFPSLLRKKARSWYNHESTDPNGLETWAQLKGKFLRRFCELGYDSRVLTKLRNLQQEQKENLRDYKERFQDLLDRIPKKGAGVPFSVQQAVEWYVTGLPREMETFCRRGKCDTMKDVIASAEAFETSTLNRRGREQRELVG